ncbi:hypothetical protein GcM1_145006, partial [Golovinomyces cichoracearum]
QHNKAPPEESYGESSTRCDPSLHYNEVLKLLLSTAAPFIIEEDEDPSFSLFFQFPNTALMNKLKWDINESSPELGTTAIRIPRDLCGIRDLYVAGTGRKRAHMRSIKFDKLGSTSIEELSIEVSVDNDVQMDT